MKPRESSCRLPKFLPRIGPHPWKRLFVESDGKLLGILLEVSQCIPFITKYPDGIIPQAKLKIIKVLFQ